MDKHAHDSNCNCINGIICDVSNCVYNDLNHNCTATEVKVGPQFASTSYDTICSTFKPD